MAIDPKFDDTLRRSGADVENLKRAFRLFDNDLIATNTLVNSLAKALLSGRLKLPTNLEQSISALSLALNAKMGDVNKISGMLGISVKETGRLINAAKHVIGKLSSAIGKSSDEIAKSIQALYFADSAILGLSKGKISRVQDAIRLMTGKAISPEMAVSSIVSGHSYKAERFKELHAEIVNSEMSGTEKSAALAELRRQNRVEIGRQEALAKGGTSAAEAYDRNISRVAASSITSVKDTVSKMGGAWAGGVVEGSHKGFGPGSFLQKLYKAELDATTKGIPMTASQKLMSAGIGKAASALPGGNLALALGPWGVAAAGVASALKFGLAMVDATRKLHGQALTGAMQGIGSATEKDYTLAIARSSVAARHRYAKTGKADELIENVTDSLTRLGNRAGMSAGDVETLSDNLFRAQGAGSAFGMSTKQSTQWIEKYVRASGDATGSYRAFNGFLSGLKFSNQSFEEASEGLGDMSEYSKSFGRSQVSGILSTLQAMGAGMGTYQKIQAQQAAQGLATSGIANLLGLSYAAYGMSGPGKLYSSLTGAAGSPNIMAYGPQMIGKIMEEKIVPSLNRASDPALREMIMADALVRLSGLKPSTATALLNEPELKERLQGKNIDMKALSGYINEQAKKYNYEEIGIEKMDSQVEILTKILNFLTENIKAFSQGNLAWAMNLDNPYIPGTESAGQKTVKLESNSRGSRVIRR